jgi:hypothetical protein
MLERSSPVSPRRISSASCFTAPKRTAPKRTAHNLITPGPDALAARSVFDADAGTEIQAAGRASYNAAIGYASYLRLSVVFAKATNTSVRDMATQRIQTIWRGRQARKHIQVRSVAEGLIFVRLSGDRRFFERIGLHGETACSVVSKGAILKEAVLKGSAPTGSDNSEPYFEERQLAYLAVDHRRFRGCVLAQKGRLSHPRDFHNPSEPSREEPSSRSFSVPYQRAARPVAYVNGGFFNHRQFASTDAEEQASIGRSGHQNGSLPSLPLPDDYRDDYRQVSFEDGSLLNTGPQLSFCGTPVFTEAMLEDPKYDLEAGFSLATDKIIPGHLRHAAGRHPRAAISAPSARGRHAHMGWSRLAVGIVKDRDADPEAGYTMAEWAKMTARLDRLSSPPNASVNLDGGKSVALGVAGLGKRDVRVAQFETGRPVANFIGFVERTVSSQAADGSEPLDRSRIGIDRVGGIGGVGGVGGNARRRR